MNVRGTGILLQDRIYVLVLLGGKQTQKRFGEDHLKAVFLYLRAKAATGIGVAVGSASEGEVTIMTTRYALFVDGEEMFLIDRLSSIVRIGGKDYAANIGSML